MPCPSWTARADSQTKFPLLALAFVRDEKVVKPGTFPTS